MDPNSIDLSQMPDVGAAPMGGPPPMPGNTPPAAPSLISPPNIGQPTPQVQSNPSTLIQQAFGIKPKGKRNPLAEKTAKLLANVDINDDDAVTAAEKNYIATRPSERADDASRRYWLSGEYAQGKSKKRIWGERIGKGISEVIQAVASRGRYVNPRDRALAEANAEYKLMAPEFQKDISGRDAAQAKQYAAQLQLKGRETMAAARERIAEANNNAQATVRGAHAEQMKAIGEKYKAYVASGIMDEQSALIQHNAEIKGLQADYFKKNGRLEATPEEANARALMNGGESYKNARLLDSLIKGAPGLMKAGAGVTSSHEIITPFQTPEGATQLTRSIVSGSRSNPGAVQGMNMLQQMLGGNFTGQGGQQPQQPPQPANPMLGAPVKTPINVPSPVGKAPGANGAQTSNKHISDFYIPTDAYGPKSQLKLPPDVVKDKVSRDLISNTSNNLVHSIIDNPYPAISKARTMTNLGALPGVGHAIEFGRNLLNAKPFSEANLVAALNKNQINLVREYGGKRPNVKELNIAASTEASTSDSTDNLIKKVFKHKLEEAFQRKIIYGDEGKTNWGIYAKHHPELYKGFYNSLNDNVETLFKKYKDGQISMNDFEPDALIKLFAQQTTGAR